MIIKTPKLDNESFKTLLVLKVKPLRSSVKVLFTEKIMKL